MATIAIVGRANVGKSTLFNRLIEESKAIVSDIPGTTRDRNYGICKWRGKNLILIDTGGLDVGTKDIIEIGTAKQAETAIKEASAILFVVDAKIGLVKEDRDLARTLHKLEKPVLLITNKADSPALREKAESNTWRALGFEDPIPVSAANGSGTGDLLDILIKKLKIKKGEDIFDKPFTRIVLLGKPNVGKSSIVNSLLGEERVIVSDIPHTTREPEDSILVYKDRPFLLVDTAGIRKKAKVGRGLERIGVSRSIKALERANVALFVIDIDEELGVQDKKIARLIVDKQKGVIVIVNKIDLVEKEDTKEFVDIIRINFPFLDWAPVIFTSAATKKGISKILDLSLEIDEERQRKVEQKDLEEVLREIKAEHERPKIYKLKQIKINPPVFGILIKRKTIVHPSFIKFVENRLRRKFKFKGVPIRVEILNIQ
ncbi:MAG: ribosome biogenesis GTPase Der [Parcubacteria group bacterium]|nr:ribosome biogenesis GTPase Der [Parcubacteria group bacterium]